MSILKQIVAATQERVQIEKKAGLPQPGAASRLPFLFEQRLRRPGLSFICEIKRSSPSKGVIAEEFPYLDIASDYNHAGANAISVLTEPAYFQGRNRYLAEIRQTVETPLLRKDFIIDPFQIEQSGRLGADAVLLICAILTPAQLADFIRIADSLGLSCLVETHDETELRTALHAGARLVGVNNRNLNTFTIDMDNSLRLRKLVPTDVIFVSESGIRTAADVAILRQNHVDAVLIGEALMRAPDKRAALNALRESGPGGEAMPEEAEKEAPEKETTPGQVTHL